MEENRRGDGYVTDAYLVNVKEMCTARVLRRCVLLETMAVTEKQPEKVQVYEKHLVRIIVVVKKLIRENG